MDIEQAICENIKLIEIILMLIFPGYPMMMVLYDDDYTGICSVEYQEV